MRRDEQYILFNGEILKFGEADLSHLVANDPVVFREKIWFGHGGLPLFSENVHTLIRGLNELALGIPDYLLNSKELLRLTKRMLNKNRMYRSGVLTMQIFVGQSSTEHLIIPHAFEGTDFPISGKGLLVHFSDIYKRSRTGLQNLEYGNQPLWNTETALNKQTLFHNSIFLNENNSVCDAISSNVFMLKKNKLITPSVETGCYTDTIRDLVIQTGKELDFKIEESEKIHKGDVIGMDEIILASEEKGIEWVMGIENKRFIHRIAGQIHDKLNDLLRQRVMGSVK